MVEFKIFKTEAGLFLMGMTTQSRLAIPGPEQGVTPPRVPLSRAQFEACKHELRGHARRGTVRFEATGGARMEEVPMSMVEDFFAKGTTLAEPVKLPEAPASFVAQAKQELSVAVAELAKEQGGPPPAPWMNVDPSTENEPHPQ